MPIQVKIKDRAKLAELIYKSGYTIRSLARESNMADSTIQFLIDGRRTNCSPKTAKAILEKLESAGVNFDDLFFVENTYKSQNELPPTGTEG
ncbi:hypothetical protein [Hydrogenispora ethanolica]|uniref:hypothetical protein n=1 Tax=Hydrogenispora ethanolica TaxID=1082276 RepID=UPI0010518551|nr:hypothetical protein [Hydrogenispora ethanolica]